jgi:hypothetical protein
MELAMNAIQIQCLEEMVEDVGIADLLTHLSIICEDNAGEWDDETRSEVWSIYALICTTAANEARRLL